MKRRNFLKSVGALVALLPFGTLVSKESLYVPALSLRVWSPSEPPSNKILLFGIPTLDTVPHTFIDDGVDFIIEETKNFKLGPTEKVYIEVAYDGKAVDCCFWSTYVKNRRGVLEKSIERGIKEIMWHREKSLMSF